MKLVCQIYRSPRKAGMYLYVDKQEGTERVPDALLTQFGVPEEAFTLLLSPERTLARANAEEVLSAISDQGFYLQMPPSESEMAAARLAPAKSND
ncbi:MAG: YcgL domain-containing protein [Halioglobus sp.]